MNVCCEVCSAVTGLLPELSELVSEVPEACVAAPRAGATFTREGVEELLTGSRPAMFVST